jgi:hypothetical protein
MAHERGECVSALARVNGAIAEPRLFREDRPDH